MANYSDFTMRIADINVRMLCSFPYALRLCQDFTVEGEAAELTVSVTQKEIDAERGNYDNGAFSDGYCEGICLYRAIAERLPQGFDGFVFHGAALEINGEGCVFAARSGVGKTTHIKLLLENYPDNVKIINGDKPIIRRIDGEWRICSTPWAGKESMLRNTSAPLRSLILLERSPTNFIEKISPSDHFDAIAAQTYLPKSGEGQLKTFDLLDEMSRKVQFYRLGCNISDEAAKTSYAALSKQ